MGAGLGQSRLKATIEQRAPRVWLTTNQALILGNSIRVTLWYLQLLPIFSVELLKNRNNSLIVLCSLGTFVGSVLLIMATANLEITAAVARLLEREKECLFWKRLLIFFNPSVIDYVFSLLELSVEWCEN